MLESFGFRNEGSFSSDLKVSILPKTKTRLPKPPGKPNQITKYVRANIINYRLEIILKNTFFLQYYKEDANNNNDTIDILMNADMIVTLLTMVT